MDTADFDLLKCLIQSDAALALARAEIDALNEAIWVIRADGYRPADPGYPTLAESGIVEWNEARRWRRGQMIELTAQAVYEGNWGDLNLLVDASYLNFRGIAWRPASVRPVVERHDLYMPGRSAPVDVAFGRRTLEIDLVATAAQDSKGPPRPIAPVKDRAWFLAILDQFNSTAPVMLENGQIGMANHWSAEGVLIDAYQGNEHMGVYRVPYANLIHMGGGAFTASLKGVPPPTDAEGVRG